MSQTTFKRVPVEQLRVDDRYQRELDSARVARIAKQFDPAKLGALEVSQRNGGGSYYVFDGQHRLAAALTAGQDKLPCLVHKGLSPEAEANMFVTQRALSKNVHPVDRFRAKVFCGDPRAVEIDRIVTEHGYAIRSAGINRGLNSYINTPAAVDYVYGLGVLPEALALLAELWRGDEHSTDAPLIQGLGIVVQGYRGRIGEAEKTRLREVAPLTVLRRGLARAQHALGGNPNTRGMLVAAEIRKTAGLRGAPAGPKKRTRSRKAKSTGRA